MAAGSGVGGGGATDGAGRVGPGTVRVTVIVERGGGVTTELDAGELGGVDSGELGSGELGAESGERNVGSTGVVGSAVSSGLRVGAEELPVVGLGPAEVLLTAGGVCDPVALPVPDVQPVTTRATISNISGRYSLLRVMTRPYAPMTSR